METTSRNLYRNSNLDGSLLLCVFSLMGIGLVLIYSASFIFAMENFSDGLYFFKRQGIFVCLALAVLWGTSMVPFSFYKKFFVPLYLITLGLLAATYVPALSYKAGGASRWILLPGGFHLEPSELAKLVSVFIFSWLLTYERPQNQSAWKVRILSLLLVGVPILLLLKQPDFGSSVIFFLIGLTLLFCFGLPWGYLISLVLISLPAFYFLVMRVDYRRRRILSFLNPWDDVGNSGFQVVQSLLSFHAGGFWGTGLGKGQSKLYFLPEAHTDFILAVLGEETGFLGFAIVTLLFVWIVFRGLQIAVLAKDPFARRVAVGMSSLIGYQAIINVGVVTGLLPTKGLTMPFLSYGGSSLIAVSVACGVLINIHRSSAK